MQYNIKEYNTEFLGLDVEDQEYILQILNTGKILKSFIKINIPNDYALEQKTFNIFKTINSDFLILNKRGLEDPVNQIKLSISKIIETPIVLMAGPEEALTELQTVNTYRVYSKVSDPNFVNELVVTTMKAFNKKPKLSFTEATSIYKANFSAFKFIKDEKSSEKILENLLLSKIEKGLIQHRGCCR